MLIELLELISFSLCAQNLAQKALLQKLLSIIRRYVKRSSRCKICSFFNWNIRIDSFCLNLSVKRTHLRSWERAMSSEFGQLSDISHGKKSLNHFKSIINMLNMKSVPSHSWPFQKSYVLEIIIQRKKYFEGFILKIV